MHNTLNNKLRHCLLWLPCLLLWACGGPQEPLYRIGVSQCSGGYWREKQNNEMRREALLHEGVSLEFRCAVDDNARQTADIQYFMDQRVDLLVVSPHDVDALAGIVAKAYDSGIPVLLFDRYVKGDRYSAFVGGDNIGVGKIMAAYVATRLPQGGTVLELMGDMQTSPARQRHEGLLAGLKERTDIRLLASVDAGWLGPRAAAAGDSLLRVYPEVDVVVAHSDFMAKEVKKVADQLLPGHDILFVGADGFGSPGLGVEAVETGEVDATAIYPTGGDAIIQTALKLLRGEPCPRETLLPSHLVSTPQEATLLINMDRALTAEVERVEGMHHRAVFYLEQSHVERMMLYATLGILVLACLLCMALYRLNKIRKQANRRLREQQDTLRRHNEQLLTMTKDLEEATNAKLVFFTNISHDFRTPLTLISAPLEQAVQQLDAKMDAHVVLPLLQIAQRNVRVLLDLLNQILDFRKVENGKMRLNRSEADLREAFRQWHESFATLAERKGIHLQLVVNEADWRVRVDVRKLERMVYNLIGNSIKFTARGGTIALECHLGEELTVTVRDTGAGIDKENLSRIFERFYQIDSSNMEGAGIGLALVKKYAELMGGQVRIASRTESSGTEGTGTAITIVIPVREKVVGILADEQEKPSQAAVSAAVPLQYLAPEGLIACSDLPTSTSEGQPPVTEDEPLPVVLVIDDNADMRAFVSSLFAGKYRVLEAVDGQQGWELARENVPDIILCDVMMPVMDGMECCQHLKTDMCTSHIPVIMLTACTLDEQRVQGLACGAEAYLSKPFSAPVLLAQVETLLANRARVRRLSQLSGLQGEAAVPDPAAVPAGSPAAQTESSPAQEAVQEADQETQAEAQLSRYDKLFLEKLTAAIMGNYSDEQFSVEALARLLCLSRTQLYRKTKALTGNSPVELIRNTRLEQAHRLLTTTRMDIYDIAGAVGFGDPTYFCKCYKSCYGRHPKDVHD